MHEIIENMPYTNEEKVLMNDLVFHHKIDFDYHQAIGFQSNKHLENFVFSYLFNQNPKYQNAKTPFNRYFSVEENTKTNDLKIALEDTSEEARAWLHQLSPYSYKRVYNDIIYLDIQDYELQRKLEDNFKAPLYYYLLSAYANYIYTFRDDENPKARVKYSILHLNQEIPHLHRIIVLEDNPANTIKE